MQTYENLSHYTHPQSHIIDFRFFFKAIYIGVKVLQNFNSLKLTWAKDQIIQSPIWKNLKYIAFPN
jgi:hypothetical protein